ncbi:unnamed protein product [Cuscuta epithymum]|uniref:Retrovirus-related Pol polyprotein from transposon TNT 1-94 n=1 Tax=Cuscuta epithymum TaxID=186058 RepID=A0AAV0E1N1_9ASTE|nr:unnamed protein product [Cuscuta epithymum]
MYLKGTVSNALCFDGKSVELLGHVDADLKSNDSDGSRSTTGYVFTFGGTAVSWLSQLHKIVALSTTEAEYVAITEARRRWCGFRIYLKNLERSTRIAYFTVTVKVLSSWQTTQHFTREPKLIQNFGKQLCFGVKFYSL